MKPAFLSKRFFIFSLFCLVVLSSCEDELNRLTVFDLNYNTDFTIPSSTIIIDSPISLETPPVQTNTASRFEENNTSADNIDSIVLKELSLTIESPENGNFNFLDGISIFMSADGEEEVLIASATNLENSNTNTISLDTEDVELKNYLTKDSFNLRVETTTDEIIEQDQDIRVDSVFRVDANILGI